MAVRTVVQALAHHIGGVMHLAGAYHGGLDAVCRAGAADARAVVPQPLGQAVGRASASGGRRAGHSPASVAACI